MSWFLSRVSRHPHVERSAWLLWLGVWLAVSVINLLGSHRSVTHQYALAAEHWIAGEDLYTQDGRGFLYFPHAALLYLPLTLLPQLATDILWRFLTIGSFAAGLASLCRLAESKGGPRLFLVATIAAIPLASSAARNGQATLVITGLILLACEAIYQERWWLGTLWLCLGLAFKPLVVVPMLLAGALYRPLSLRLLSGVALTFCMPYLLQRPDYVTSQYLACVEMFHSATRLGIHREWAQLFGLLKIAGLETEAGVQMAIRCAAAIATLATGWFAQKQLPPRRAVFYLFSLSVCYLMLFNPRTENNTYAMLAPALAVALAESLCVDRNRLSSGLLALLSLGTVGSYEVGRWLMPDVRPVWLAPLMALLFAHYVVGYLILESRRAPQPVSLLIASKPV